MADRRSSPSRLATSETDPTPLFDLFRGNVATEVLVVAAVHLRIFDRIDEGESSYEGLRLALELAPRPMRVLMTALAAMGLLVESDGTVTSTPLARRHLVAGAAHDIADYFGLAASSPGVLALLERLRTNRPAGAEPGQDGAAFIFREGAGESAMEHEESARRLTMALAGRANIVAPVLAERVSLDQARLLLDVGGGTGLYAIAWLERCPQLRAVVWDRPEVLKVAAELAARHGVADRLVCAAGDMFQDDVPVPGADVVLLSNVLHDWDDPQNRALVRRCAAALAPGGRLVVHDVFLDDAQSGPLPVALYSVSLFTLTEGRAYSAAECRTWLRDAGLEPAPGLVSTRVHCAALVAEKPAGPA